MRNGGLASVRRHCHRDRAPIALHLQGDPPEPGARAWTARNLPAQPDRTSAPTPVGALATATSGLVSGAIAPVILPDRLPRARRLSAWTASFSPVRVAEP